MTKGEVRGNERMEEEFRMLYESGGCQLTPIVPTKAEVNAIEGKKK